MTKFFPLASALALASTLAWADAAQDACAQKLPPADIVVQPEYAAPTGEYNLSYKEITALTRQSTLGTFTLGITRYQMGFRTQYGIRGLTLSNGSGGCGRASIHLTFRLDPISVAIGKEFRPGTCEFKFVYDHEARHVIANQEHLAYVSRQMQAELQQYMSQRIYYGSESAMMGQVQRDVETVWIPRARAYMDLVKERHARIDTPEEYARSNHVCDGAIQSIMRNSR